MENHWHSDQGFIMCPDVKAYPCPWCGSEFIVVDSKIIDFEVCGEKLTQWSAQARCHECGAVSPSSEFGSWSHPLEDEYNQLDWENEREVVNFAVKVWNCRK
jgi:DNA-directed RNA polymerase subunit RPC12/RpoP